MRFIIGLLWRWSSIMPTQLTWSLQHTSLWFSTTGLSVKKRKIIFREFCRATTTCFSNYKNFQKLSSWSSTRNLLRKTLAHYGLLETLRRSHHTWIWFVRIASPRRHCATGQCALGVGDSKRGAQSATCQLNACFYGVRFAPMEAIKNVWGHGLTTQMSVQLAAVISARHRCAIEFKFKLICTEAPRQ